MTATASATNCNMVPVYSRPRLSNNRFLGYALSLPYIQCCYHIWDCIEQTRIPGCASTLSSDRCSKHGGGIKVGCFYSGLFDIKHLYRLGGGCAQASISAYFQNEWLLILYRSFWILYVSQQVLIPLFNYNNTNSTSLLLQTRRVLALIDSLKNGQLCLRCNSSIVLDQIFVLFLIQYPKVYGLEFTWEKLMKKLHLQGYCQPYNASGTCITNYSRSLKWNAVLILHVRCSLYVCTSQ